MSEPAEQTMTVGELIDEIDRRLAADEEVPAWMAGTLLAWLPREQRDQWLRIAVRMAWRPEPLDDRLVEKVHRPDQPK